MSKTTRPKTIEIGVEDIFWEFKDGNRWTRMDSTSSTAIEKEYQKNKSGSFQITFNYTNYKM